MTGVSEMIRAELAFATPRKLPKPSAVSGRIVVLDVALPPRQFTILRHKERHLTAAAREFEAVCRAPATPQA